MDKSILSAYVRYVTSMTFLRYQHCRQCNWVAKLNLSQHRLTHLNRMLLYYYTIHENTQMELSCFIHPQCTDQYGRFNNQQAVTCKCCNFLIAAGKNNNCRYLMHFSPSATVGLNHITNAVIEMQKFTDAERLKREHIKRSTIPPLTHTHTWAISMFVMHYKFLYSVAKW